MDNASCAFKTTQSRLMIEQPLPLIYIMNVSWFGNELNYIETFYFAISIPHEFKCKEIYAEDQKLTKA